MTKRQKQRLRFEHNQRVNGCELLNRFAKRYQTSEDGYANKNAILPGDKDYDLAPYEERYSPSDDPPEYHQSFA